MEFLWASRPKPMAKAGLPWLEADGVSLGFEAVEKSKRCPGASCEAKA